ncbi:hypothetical protein DFA_08487 [Cavenderia fasciculata]|uniref:Transmembrane protein n=1 Tax=Cavenderia fasciculata TaxID=261658 RepID=F4Q2M4_CACFS|nr:uncharacterized protein DFA_08487 [Cavenderia fasciculata]EGG17491.1 hypothetical protein DFA_08487 [Cavenderia fasciculata]|eukprot:XP_004355975.1 hypothetical protein DFA_08487 [Cavenderia fasciculata]
MIDESSSSSSSNTKITRSYDEDDQKVIETTTITSLETSTRTTRLDRFVTFVNNSAPYQYEVLAVVCGILGVILSICSGSLNRDWVEFPSTISTLNSNFNQASGRIFFASLLSAGICFIKSDTVRYSRSWLQAINSSCYISIIVIGLIPTASFNGGRDNLFLIAIHGTAAGYLFFISPIIKFLALSIGQNSKPRTLSTVARLFLTAASSICFVGFVILQSIIWSRGYTDMLTTKSSSSSDSDHPYAIPINIASFTLEGLCAILVFVELVISTKDNEVIESRKNLLFN